MRSSLLIPLIAGLGAAVFALWALLNTFNEAKKRAERPVEYADVIVAKTEIPYASLITEQMLERVRIPKPHPLKNTIADAESLAGRVAAMRIVKGTPVLTNMLAGKNTPPGATQLIHPEYRTVSVSVPVGDVEDLNPGDRVDVLYAAPARDRRDKQRNMELMYNSVEVFSVGDKRIGMGMAVPQPGEKDGKNKGGRNAALRRGRDGRTTVKLLLPFEKAKVFEAAKLNGNIFLLPRRFDDDTRHVEIDLRFDAPPEPKPKTVEVAVPKAPPPPPRRMIRVIQGGKDVSKEGTTLRNEEGGASLRATPTVGDSKPASPQAAGRAGYVPDLIERAARAGEERRALIDIGE